MKKQASPVPTPRAVALSQSASRFSAGATSAWQNIASKSPRLTATSSHGAGAARIAAPLAPPNAPRLSRVALEPQRALHVEAAAAKPETIRQVGWREVDQAVGMSTKRKYSLLGIRFGPKVPVFETEKVKLPVYQEADQNKRYYAVTKPEDAAAIRHHGLRATDGTGQALTTLEQFNSRGHLAFFATEAAARAHGRTAIGEGYSIVEFAIPEYHSFSPSAHLQQPHAMCTTQHIPAACIKNISTSRH